MSLQAQKKLPRRWYLDAISALMAAMLAYFVGRGLKGFLPLALLLVIFLLGMAYYFGRSAWRGLMLALGNEVV
jgi:hypothetical protein